MTTTRTASDLSAARRALRACYVSEHSFALHEDPELVAQDYDAVEQAAAERARWQRDIAVCIANRDRGRVRAQDGDRGKLGSEV